MINSHSPSSPDLVEDEDYDILSFHGSDMDMTISGSETNLSDYDDDRTDADYTPHDFASELSPQTRSDPNILVLNNIMEINNIREINSLRELNNIRELNSLREMSNIREMDDIREMNSNPMAVNLSFSTSSVISNLIPLDDDLDDDDDGDMQESEFIVESENFQRSSSEIEADRTCVLPGSEANDNLEPARTLEGSEHTAGDESRLKSARKPQRIVKVFISGDYTGETEAYIETLSRQPHLVLYWKDMKSGRESLLSKRTVTERLLDSFLLGNFGTGRERSIRVHLWSRRSLGDDCEHAARTLIEADRSGVLDIMLLLPDVDQDGILKSVNDLLGNGALRSHLTTTEKGASLDYSSLPRRRLLGSRFTSFRTPEERFFSVVCYALAILLRAVLCGTILAATGFMAYSAYKSYSAYSSPIGPTATPLVPGDQDIPGKCFYYEPATDAFDSCRSLTADSTDSDSIFTPSGAKDSLQSFIDSNNLLETAKSRIASAHARTSELVVSSQKEASRLLRPTMNELRQALLKAWLEYTATLERYGAAVGSFLAKGSSAISDFSISQTKNLKHKARILVDAANQHIPSAESVTQYVANTGSEGIAKVKNIAERIELDKLRDKAFEGASRLGHSAAANVKRGVEQAQDSQIYGQAKSSVQHITVSMKRAIEQFQDSELAKSAVKAFREAAPQRHG